MFISKYGKSIIIILLILILLSVVVKLSMDSSMATDVMQDAVGSPLQPAQKALSSVGKFFSNIWYTVTNYDKLIKENEELVKKVYELEQKMPIFDELAMENETLKDMLNFSQRQTEFELVGAEVINRDSDSWFSMITLDKGRKHGISADMCVISENGLVGRIIEVGYNWSKVMLILDEGSSISGIVQFTRDSGIVKGTVDKTPQGYLKMVYLSGKAEIREGQRVVSSGLGGIVPKGILIGIIKEVVQESHTLLQYAIIEPAADMDRLEKVFIITDYVPFIEQNEGGEDLFQE